MRRYTAQLQRRYEAARRQGEAECAELEALLALCTQMQQGSRKHIACWEQPSTAMRDASSNADLILGEALELFSSQDVAHIRLVVSSQLRVFGTAQLAWQDAVFLAKEVGEVWLPVTNLGDAGEQIGTLLVAVHIAEGDLENFNCK
jgi:hypothetical protein